MRVRRGHEAKQRRRAVALRNIRERLSRGRTSVIYWNGRALSDADILRLNAEADVLESRLPII